MMRGALEAQERMDGRQGCRVRGSKANLGSAGAIGCLIGDPGAASRHDGCAWDYLRVYLEWLAKVADSKRCYDLAHVFSDGDDASGVRSVLCVKDDPPTIYKILKNVR
jgi:hypothetical protein